MLVTYDHIHDVGFGARVLSLLTASFKGVLFHHKVVQAAPERPDIHCSGHLCLPLELGLVREKFWSGKWKMASEVFAFEQFKVVIGQANQIEHRFAIAPV